MGEIGWVVDQRVDLVLRGGQPTEGGKEWWGFALVVGFPGCHGDESQKGRYGGFHILDLSLDCLWGH